MGPSILFVAALMLAVLWRFQPSGQFFYPRCAFYELTGWKCPGCGGTRATHALLHGNVSGAWNDNPLAVLLAPLGAWLLAREVTGRSTGRWWPMPRPPFWVWLAAGGMAAAFGVLRNCI
jgi:Protein of unknown function (DUF2752)